MSLERDEKEEGLEGDENGEPSECMTVAEALGALVATEKFHDVIFLVGKGKDQRCIPAHKIVLAASSDIFEAMLYPIEFPDEKSESKSGIISFQNTPEIEIPDVSPAAFRIMLQCLYSDDADIKAEDLPDIIALSKKFHLESLRQLCITFMEEGVTPDNACVLFAKAEDLLNEKNFAMNYIEEHIEQVAASTGWDGLSKAHLKSILESSKLCIEEIDLFKAVMRWSLAECRRQGLAVSQDHRNQVLKDVIPLIRFPSMTMEEVAMLVSPSGVLSQEQLLQVFTYLGNPAKKPRIDFDTKRRSPPRDKWKFDVSLHSTALSIGDGRSYHASATGYQYALGAQFFDTGRHAWRVVRNSGPGALAWLFLGVARKMTYSDQSYTSPTVWGFNSASQQYKAGQMTTVATNFGGGPLDVLYDADEGTLTVQNLMSSTLRYEMAIPKNQQLVPYFCTSGAQVFNIVHILPKDVGKKDLKQFSLP